jgi:hypothetical protein
MTNSSHGVVFQFGSILEIEKIRAFGPLRKVEKLQKLGFRYPCTGLKWRRGVVASLHERGDSDPRWHRAG